MVISLLSYPAARADGPVDKTSQKPRCIRRARNGSSSMCAGIQVSSALMDGGLPGGPSRWPSGSEQNEPSLVVSDGRVMGHRVCVQETKSGQH